MKLAFEARRGVPLDGDSGRPYGAEAGEYTAGPTPPLDTRAP